MAWQYGLQVVDLGLEGSERVHGARLMRVPAARDAYRLVLLTNANLVMYDILPQRA